MSLNTTPIQAQVNLDQLQTELIQAYRHMLATQGLDSGGLSDAQILARCEEDDEATGGFQEAGEDPAGCCEESDDSDDPSMQN